MAMSEKKEKVITFALSESLEEMIKDLTNHGKELDGSEDKVELKKDVIELKKEMLNIIKKEVKKVDEEFNNGTKLKEADEDRLMRKLDKMSDIIRYW